MKDSAFARFGVKFRDFIRRTIVQQAIRSIAWVLTLFGVGIGIALITGSSEVVERPTFSANFDFAQPHIWGLAFLVHSVWLGLALLQNINMAPLALYFLTVLTGLWGIFTLPAVLHNNGSATAIFAYIAIALITMIVGLAIEEEGRANDRFTTST